MPVNMFRRHLANLEGSSTNQSQGDYFVTEKTDGERKLLVVVEAGNPPTVFHVLVDRSLRVSSVRPNNVTNSASSSASSSASLAVGTVLDGEVVFNLTLQRHVFMVFDLLRLGGNPANANGPSGGCVVHLPWRQRVSQLPLPALEATQSPHHALPLAAKTFWPASKIDHLFKHMVPGNNLENEKRTRSRTQRIMRLTSIPLDLFSLLASIYYSLELLSSCKCSPSPSLFSCYM